jgi:hypothetical protein
MTLDPQARFDAAIAQLPAAFQGMVSSQAYDRGHSAGMDEVAAIAEGLVANLLPCIEDFKATL